MDEVYTLLRKQEGALREKAFESLWSKELP